MRYNDIALDKKDSFNILERHLYNELPEIIFTLKISYNVFDLCFNILNMAGGDIARCWILFGRSVLRLVVVMSVFLVALSACALITLCDVAR